jgi:hypothetical protein
MPPAGVSGSGMAATPPSTRASRADRPQGAKVVRPVGRSTLASWRRPAPRTAGRWQTGWQDCVPPACLKDRVPEENTGPDRCKRRLTLDEPKAKRRPRFRWSASCQPGEELVARGGVEPPTFRFSGGRSYQLSYLAVLGSWYPRPGSGRCARAANQDAARITHGVGVWRS